MELHSIGIDLGKTVFHLIGLNRSGEVVVRKKFSRIQLLRFTANIHVQLIGIGCSSVKGSGRFASAYPAPRNCEPSRMARAAYYKASLDSGGIP
jgi:hypothetical protein